MSEIPRNALFSVLSSDETEATIQAGSRRSLGLGEVVFEEGDPGNGLYLVISGSVEISAQVGEAGRRVLNRVMPGDFFGEMAVLESAPRSATARAEGPSEVLFLPTSAVEALLDTSPRFASCMMREVCHRMRSANSKYTTELVQAERLSTVGRFARSIVHDFKNPLGIIGMSAELATMRDATDEMRNTARGHIFKQVERLSNMVSELLEFTRGSQNTAALGPADYAGFVLPLVDDLRMESAPKHVSIELENQPPAVDVLMDTRRLPNVFYNLAHNAVDAMAPAGGRIILRFKCEDKSVLTELEDTGKGIAPEIASRIFEPFATFGKAKGTGLGLSICQRIVADHGGTIGTRSEPGHGAIFWFRLNRDVRGG